MENLLETSTAKRRTAIYIRVSTEEQDLEGYGLVAQKSELLAYIKNNTNLGLITDPKWIYSDVHTGSDVNREGLEKLREDVKAGKYDAVLVWKIDRLSRSLQHLLLLFKELKESKVSFISMKENIDFRGAIGSLIFQIFGAIAEFERELIKDRTLMGKLASAKQGNYTGTYIPYGYRPLIELKKKGKRIELVPEEKKWVEQMFEWYVYEGLGDGQIAKKLNENQVQRKRWEKDKKTGAWLRVPTNAKWTPKMITAILTNDLYRGTYYPHIKDESGNVLPQEKWIIVPVPACVGEVLFMQAENIRKKRIGGSTDTDYMLSGKLKDMTIQPPRTFVGAKRFKGGFSYRRKQFNRGAEHYQVFEVPGKKIDEAVWAKIMSALKDPEVFIKHYLSKEFTDPTRLEKLTRRLQELRAQKMNKDLEIGKIEAAYQEGVYTLEKMHGKVSQCNKESSDVELAIVEIEKQLRLASFQDLEVQKLREAAEQVKFRLHKLDPRQKKILCNLFVTEVRMTRRENPEAKSRKNKWIVGMDVGLRFNPDKFSEAPEGVEPDKVLSKPKIGNLHGKIDDYGGPGGI